MSFPINNNQTPDLNNVPVYVPPAPLPAPVAAPATTSTAPPSAAQFGDGSFVDAQVTLSSAAAADPMCNMIANQIAMDNFMFNQQMFQMQQRQQAANRQAQQAKTNSNDTKLAQPPDIKSADSGDDGGDAGDYGEAGGEE